MSYLTQMLGLTVQNFVSAAAGHGGAGGADPRLRAEAGAGRSATSGWTWCAARSTSCCRCPRCWRWSWSRRASCRPSSPASPCSCCSRRRTPNGQPVTEQTLAVGPAASQIAIKQLGTNGGGFFNVNSAHPFENPTPLSNFLESLSILLIGGGAVLHLRRDGRRPAAGLGAAGGHDPDLRAVPVAVRVAGAGGQSGPGRSWASTRPPSRSSPAATWRARRSASASSSSALWATATTVGLQRLGQLPCTTPSRRWAAWCRCG